MKTYFIIFAIINWKISLCFIDFNSKFSERIWKIDTLLSGNQVQIFLAPLVATLVYKLVSPWAIRVYANYTKKIVNNPS